jgi:16S rRNA (adenine1518-N6/adenine1519-N6)-dimethyltransferase
MPSNSNIKNILQERNLFPKKRFGQNFLVHQKSAERIVTAAEIVSTDTILEIGVGLGALTRILAKQADRVIGLEVDKGIVRWLEEKGDLPSNVTLLHQDVMKADFHEIAAMAGGGLKIVANLPYSLSNPLLFKLVDNRTVLEWAVIMLQKEVGERLMAEVGTKAYGILTVLIKTCATVSPLLDLGPGHFYPRPKVDSQVLRIDFTAQSAHADRLGEYDQHLLGRIVNAAFQQRRKILLNALSAGCSFNLTKFETERVIRAAAISPTIRAERLSVDDYARLTRSFQDKLQE